ncbi:flagellar biosynthesis protein FlhA [Kangiella sp. HZ709]|uniref:flagellar biosynthesis protein FlhA n=1 Tax=Kangiella sp. HZ709 TaxID=2666328 RepID=UPI0012B097F1|nr:flagellar biosynthesis protein FlhA [Kangiella sp. HZ709]MRX26859.1 flagellar type III secretion system protein FlhA [Kangiella sp. HZ709]
MASMLKTIKTNISDLGLVIGMVAILMILFLPIPSGLLDFLLITNFSFGLLILLITFYTDKPLSFSTFPSLLLIATLFRLALNISATRLILDDADAGEVINAVGSFVVGGNYVIGMVVFLILIVVQYVVVTNGAQRVAEVAARFTLDSMPGKQMSIDADLNMGLIDEVEAKERRANIEKEANFYGAMDGATKFVKGDAIAGIIIILIDIIGGLSIGLGQKGMAWGEALQTYTLLTVGDGIVTQIPSLVIATATGIIITRAATDAQLGSELSKQITAYPKTLMIIVVALSVLVFLPGLPTFPILIVLAGFTALTYFAFTKKDTDVSDESDDKKKKSSVYDEIKQAPITIKINNKLQTYLDESDDFPSRVNQIRKKHALEYGYVPPEMDISVGKRLDEYGYQILLSGAKVAEYKLVPNSVLCIGHANLLAEVKGEETLEPTYQIPAKWILNDKVEQAQSLGLTIVEPLTVINTHLTETLKKYASALLTRNELENILIQYKDTSGSVIDELIPNILSLSDIQKVLQILLDERVSIRNFDIILESLVDTAKNEKRPEVLSDKVRESLGRHICDKLAINGELSVLTLDPELETNLTQKLRLDNDSPSLVINPDISEKLMVSLANNSERMMNENKLPILLCSPLLRRHVKKLTDRVMPHLSVISISELPSNLNVQSYGIVEL